MKSKKKQKAADLEIEKLKGKLERMKF